MRKSNVLLLAAVFSALTFSLTNIFSQDSVCLTVVETAESIQKKIVLELPPGENNPRNSEGDFIRLKSGEILFVYTYFYGGSDHDNAHAKLVSRISSDNGETWSDKDELVLENEGLLNVMSVSLLRLQDDSIALFYLVKENAGDCRPYLRYSFDEGKTWTERIEMIAEPSFNVLNNSRVIQLPEGRLVAPIAYHEFIAEQNDNAPNATLFCLYSDDNGRSWKKSELVPNAENLLFQEPGVVELADGRLLMTIRASGGRQRFCYSEDRGATWSEPFASPLISPVSPAEIKRDWNSDKLISVWNESTGGRDPLTIAILSPDGKTILSKKTLDRSLPNETRGFCYPALFFVDQNIMLVAYCAAPNAWGIHTTRISKIDLRDLR